MGRSGHDPWPAADPQYQRRSTAAAAMPALPSPASVHDSLASPDLSRTLSRCESYSGNPNTTARDDVLAAGALATMPDLVTGQPLSTPKTDFNVGPSLDPPSSYGGALAIMPSAPPGPASPVVKEGPGLRLPSFQQLGIAAPHPDHIASAGLPPFPSDDFNLPTSFDHPVGGLQNPAGPLGPNHIKGDGRSVRSPVFHYLNPLTPPTESEPLSWPPPATVQTTGMHSPPAYAASGAEQPSSELNSPEAQAPAPVLPSQAPTTKPNDDYEEETWIEGAIMALLQNLQAIPRPVASCRLLSHALPSTSVDAHVFPQVINAIHNSTPPSPSSLMTWINVFHAIPGRFNLADLPSSPPSTPGPAVGGDDYFTQKTFDSAVSISDYQVATPLLPRSPRPVVPPSSIDVSIVERYIPPSTSNEFAEMFEPNGSSILVDRLVELSPTNGSLLFIYPTKTGAKTFMREYLSPILDPVLRSMSVVHGVPAHICSSIASMSAVESMLEHDCLQRGMEALCARLTQQNTTAQRFHGRRPTFAVSYAARRSIQLPRAVWAREWWAKQEKTRIKQILTNYAREAEARRSSSDFSSQTSIAAVLLQELLGRVSGKGAQDTEMVAAGIEVGIFVIKRSV